MSNDACGIGSGGTGTKTSGSNGSTAYVSGGECTIQIDIGALEESASRARACEDALVEALRFARDVRSALENDWAEATQAAKAYAERMLSQNCQIVEDRPNSFDLSRKATLIEDLNLLESRILKASPRMGELAEVAFKAAIEYKSANGWAGVGAGALTLLTAPLRFQLQASGTLLLNTIAVVAKEPRLQALAATSRNVSVQWGMFMYSNATTFSYAKDRLGPDKQYSEVESAQRALFLGNEKLRSLFALNLNTKLKDLSANQEQAYLPVDEALVIKDSQRPAQSTVSDSIEQFAQQNKETTGAVQITKTVENGVTSFTVMVPGTTKWTTGGKDHPLDFSSNPDSMYYDESTGTQYVLAAMKAAGVNPEDNVVLMGHSQGGIIASALASRMDFVGKYKVRGVVTMNSPTAHNNIQPGIPTLHIENKPDVVTSLDAKPVPVTKDRVQLVGVLPKGAVKSAHDVRSSKLILDANREHPSVKKVVKEIEKYLPQAGSATSTKTYDIVRK